MEDEDQGETLSYQQTDSQIETLYKDVLKSWNELSHLGTRLQTLKHKLSERTDEALRDEWIQKIIMVYKVQQMGMKSEYDEKYESLKLDIDSKDIILNKMISKNKILMVEKQRHLKLIKEKGRIDRDIDYKNIIKILK